MKIHNRFLALGAVILMLGTSHLSYADTDGSWKLDGNKWKFYQNEKILKSKWIEKDSVWYYLDNEGYMYSNQWLLKNDVWYYFGAGGNMYSSQWLLKNDVWYYFGVGGNMYSSQWLLKNDIWYYFGVGGNMYSSQWLKYGNEWYYFDKEGKMVKNHLLEYKNNIYAFDKNGKMITNSSINGYIVDGDGVAHKNIENGWMKVSGNYYYFKNNKKTISSWEPINEKWYYFDDNGAMYSKKWLEYKGKKYYFSENGDMVVNTTIDGIKINNNGEAEDSSSNENNKDTEEKSYSGQWKQIGNKWYYYDEDGNKLVSKTALINGKYYYFNNKGVMLEDDFLKQNGKYFYFSKSGSMLVNEWLDKDEKWYYFDQNGYMLSDTTVTIKGNTYSFNSDGTMKSNEWITKNGKYYLIGSDGNAVKGFYKQDGKMYYFSIVDGEMQTNMFAYDKKTKRGYNIGADGVGVVSKDYRRDFIKMVKPYMMKAIKGKGLFPSVAIAQTALETGFGSSSLGYPPVYNLFGIKAPKGSPKDEYISVWTSEYKSNGEKYDIIDNFKKFKNYDEAFAYYANLFTRNAYLTNYYRKVTNAKTPEEACIALTGTYATSPQYGRSLMQIIKQYNLKEYDKEMYTNGVKPGFSHVFDGVVYNDENGDMAFGWTNIKGNSYYFDEKTGIMATEKWVGQYYVGKDGKMLKSTTTPDGYEVGADGKVKN